MAEFGGLMKALREELVKVVQCSLDEYIAVRFYGFGTINLVYMRVTDIMYTDLDILNRDPIVERILSILQGLRINKQSMAFSLNGKWGSGKTFVLKLLAECLRQENDNLRDEDLHFCCFRYDCWKYDYYSEPLIALVSAMSEALVEGTKEGNLDYVGKELKQVGKKLAEWGIKAGGVFLQAKTGIDIVQVLSQVMNDINGVPEKNGVHELTIEKELKELRNILQEICKNNTMVIVVDELDRCLPEYMIKVLERLHHLFEGMENIVLIIATDREQLEHTIRQIYGDETDAGAYLQKMIQF